MTRHVLNLIMAVLIIILIVRIGHKIWWAWEYWLLLLTMLGLYLNNRKKGFKRRRYS